MKFQLKVGLPCTPLAAELSTHGEEMVDNERL